MTPLLAVAIPTTGRAGLGGLVHALRDQCATAGLDVEILIGVASATPLPALDARVVATNGRAAESRNQCARLARSDYLLFVDDDCSVEPGLVAGYVEAIARHPGVSAIAGGVTRVEGPGAEDVAWRQAGFDRFFSLVDCFAAVRWAPTANLLVKRDTFLRLEGFDDLGLPVGGEDIDFGLRLCAGGWGPILTLPAARVLHEPFTGELEALERKAYYYGQSEQILARRYPQYVLDETDGTNGPVPPSEAVARIRQAWERGRLAVSSSPVTFSPTGAADPATADPTQRP